jgi:hypothetical protein
MEDSESPTTPSNHDKEKSENLEMSNTSDENMLAQMKELFGDEIAIAFESK